MNARQREEAAALVLLGGLGVAVLFLAGLHIDLPDLHATDTFRAVVGAVTGLGIIVASLALAWDGVRHAHPARIVFGVLLTLIGLPLVGISVGLPPGLDAIAKALNLVLDLIHSILHAAGWVP